MPDTELTIYQPVAEADCTIDAPFDFSVHEVPGLTGNLFRIGCPIRSGMTCHKVGHDMEIVHASRFVQQFLDVKCKLVRENGGVL